MVEGGSSLLTGRTTLISGSGQNIKQISRGVGGRWFFARVIFRAVAGRCWRHVSDALAFACWLKGLAGLLS